MPWKICVLTYVQRRKICATTGASVNRCSNSFWNNCQRSFCVATDKVIKVHNRRFLSFLVRRPQRSLLQQRPSQQVLLRRPLDPLVRQCQNQSQRNVSVERRTITATPPPILQDAAMTSTSPWHENLQAGPLPKFPASLQQPDALRAPPNLFHRSPSRLRM